MAIVEVGMLSGWRPHDESVHEVSQVCRQRRGRRAPTCTISC